MKTSVLFSDTTSAGSLPAAKKPLEQQQVEAVAALFSVLSEPTRLRILQLLQAGPASVGQIVDQLGLKQANVSKQLSIMQNAGIVARRQEGNRAFYSISMAVVLDICSLVCAGVADVARQRAQQLSSGTIHDTI